MIRDCGVDRFLWGMLLCWNLSFRTQTFRRNAESVSQHRESRFLNSLSVVRNDITREDRYNLMLMVILHSPRFPILYLLTIPAHPPSDPLSPADPGGAATYAAMPAAVAISPHWRGVPRAGCLEPTTL